MSIGFRDVLGALFVVGFLGGMLFVALRFGRRMYGPRSGPNRRLREMLRAAGLQPSEVNLVEGQVPVAAARCDVLIDGQAFAFVLHEGGRFVARTTSVYVVLATVPTVETPPFSIIGQRQQVLGMSWSLGKSLPTGDPDFDRAFFLYIPKTARRGREPSVVPVTAALRRAMLAHGRDLSFGAMGNVAAVSWNQWEINPSAVAAARTILDTTRP